MCICWTHPQKVWHSRTLAVSRELPGTSRGSNFEKDSIAHKRPLSSVLWCCRPFYHSRTLIWTCRLSFNLDGCNLIGQAGTSHNRSFSERSKHEIKGEKLPFSSIQHRWTPTELWRDDDSGTFGIINICTEQTKSRAKGTGLHIPGISYHLEPCSSLWERENGQGRIEHQHSKPPNT